VARACFFIGTPFPPGMLANILQLQSSCRNSCRIGKLLQRDSSSDTAAKMTLSLEGGRGVIMS
jgi:hypothetical protein